MWFLISVNGKELLSIIRYPSGILDLYQLETSWNCLVSKVHVCDVIGEFSLGFIFLSLLKIGFFFFNINLSECLVESWLQTFCDVSFCVLGMFYLYCFHFIEVAHLLSHDFLVFLISFEYKNSIGAVSRNVYCVIILSFEQWSSLTLTWIHFQVWEIYKGTALLFSQCYSSDMKVVLIGI